MPSPEGIVESLGEIARAWTLLAILWHIFFGVLAISFLTGYRLSCQLFGALLVLPLLSVSALAWANANPFNGALFAAVSAALFLVSTRLGSSEVNRSSIPFFAVGSLLFAFGWVYPHFLGPNSLLNYLYAAPIGLIPCPTLSAVIGLTLIVGGLGSVLWPAILGFAGLFFGIYGATILGVTIDWVLFVGAIVVLVMCLHNYRSLYGHTR